jgi:hypothetical protein
MVIMLCDIAWLRALPLNGVEHLVPSHIGMGEKQTHLIPSIEWIYTIIIKVALVDPKDHATNAVFRK